MKIIERGCKKANFLQPLENAGPDPGIFIRFLPLLGSVLLRLREAPFL